jgi:hypothetical protein
LRLVSIAATYLTPRRSLTAARKRANNVRG